MGTISFLSLSLAQSRLVRVMLHVELEAGSLHVLSSVSAVYLAGHFSFFCL